MSIIGSLFNLWAGQPRPFTSAPDPVCPSTTKALPDELYVEIVRYVEAHSDLFALLLTSRLFKVEAEKRLYRQIICRSTRGWPGETVVHHDVEPLYHICRSLDLAAYVHTLDLYGFIPSQTHKERLFPQLALAYRSMRCLKTLGLPELDSESIDAIPSPYCDFRLQAFSLFEMRGNVAMRWKLSAFLERQTEIEQLTSGAYTSPDARDVMANLPSHSLPKLRSLQMLLNPALNLLSKGRRIDRIRILGDFNEFRDVSVSLTGPLPFLRTLRAGHSFRHFQGFAPNLTRLQLDQPVESLSLIELTGAIGRFPSLEYLLITTYEEDNPFDYSDFFTSLTNRLRRSCPHFKLLSCYNLRDLEDGMITQMWPDPPAQARLFDLDEWWKLEL